MADLDLLGTAFLSFFLVFKGEEVVLTKDFKLNAIPEADDARDGVGDGVGDGGGLDSLVDVGNRSCRCCCCLDFFLLFGCRGGSIEADSPSRISKLFSEDFCLRLRPLSAWKMSILLFFVAVVSLNLKGYNLI